MAISTDEKDIDPGVSFTELFPGTFLVEFEKYENDDEHNTIQANYYLAKIKEAIAEHPEKRVDVILDTTLIGNKVFSLSSKAKKAYLEALSLPITGKVAMVGFGPWLKRFVSFLTPFASRFSHISFFDTREEAITWIKSNAKE